MDMKDVWTLVKAEVFGFSVVLVSATSGSTRVADRAKIGAA